jgi:hypothetical protein
MSNGEFEDDPKTGALMVACCPLAWSREAALEEERSAASVRKILLCGALGRARDVLISLQAIQVLARSYPKFSRDHPYLLARWRVARR